MSYSHDKFIDELTSKCDEIQGNVLLEILSQNVETEYLKRHGLSVNCIDRQSFKTKVPVVTYEDIQPDIERIYNGDSSPILCAQPIIEFWRSTGTSGGKLKVIPITDAEIQRRTELPNVVLPFIYERTKELEPEEGKVFGLLLTWFEIVSPGGIIDRAALTSLIKNPKFYNDKPYPFNKNTSPIEAIHCSDHFQSTYTQLLCALYQRHDVTRIKAFFASYLVTAISFLQCNYRDLCHDISSGTLSPKITDPSLRACIINTFMDRPDTELANFVERECSSGDWAGILKRLWPKSKFLETAVTGSIAQYIPVLDHYSGRLPFVSPVYSSSECELGYNLNPICDPYDISYTIMPTCGYFEFIPLGVDTSYGTNIETVDLANVMVGQEYELVVTTYSGLYRYRLGDVLLVTGHYNSTPQFKILRRLNVVLTINNEKTTETELQEAVEKVSMILKPFDMLILDYTSNASVKSLPGHYVIYIELVTNNKNQKNGLGLGPGPGPGPGPEVLEQCCSTMEDAFGPIYKFARFDESIGPLEIRVVSNRTFEDLKDYAISQGACLSQFKMPRCVNSKPMLDLLDSRVVSAHFSPSVPDPN